jgi:hypothetical protein
MRRALVLSVFAAVVCLIACQKGLPPECETYLQQYDCWLGKMNTPGKEVTIGTMRSTWTEASKTSTGRSATKTACETSATEMSAKFAQSGCTAK